MAEELPTKEELRALPRRAIVAYAARCARRVQPLYRSRDKRRVQAVDDAIALAEWFAKGEPLIVGEASEGGLPDVMYGAGAAFAAAFAAARAARAAFADPAAAAADASKGAAAAADAAIYLLGDDALANAAAAAARAADAARGLLVVAARADYERLRSICRQALPELGDPIDPGENGPMGPLWPQGPPEGWPAAEAKEESAPEVEGDLARRAREARPAGLVSVYFDDRGFSEEEKLLVMGYLGEVYRDLGGIGLKVTGGSTLVPAREEVAV